jgi:hypothetical protein
MSQTSDLTAAEWRTLELAPFWILSSLSGTYRNFDPVELELFAEALDAAALTPGRFGRDVIASIRADLAGMQECYEVDGRSIASGLCAVADVLARTPMAEATMFRQMLFGTLGVRLAEGRGPFGRSATAEDMHKLRIAVQLLAADTSPASERAGAA